MSSFERQEIQLQRPQCKKDTKMKNYDIVSSRRARCSRCSAEISFEMSAASSYRTALQELERAEQKVQKALGSIFERAQIKLR